jgi:hypothetical protein
VCVFVCVCLFVCVALFIQDGYETQNVCFNFAYNFFSEKFFILTRNEREIIINIRRFSCKVPAILVIF